MMYSSARDLIAGVVVCLMTSAFVAEATDPTISIPPPQNLRCNDNIDPLAVLNPNPLLSWHLADLRPGSRQEAYRILVASTAEKLNREEGDLWDTGMVVSNQQSVRYTGNPVPSGGVALWKVMVRDPVHGESPWSEMATWETGLPGEADWQAGAAPAAWITGQGAFDQRPQIPASALGNWMWHAKPVEKKQLVSFVREIEIPAGTLAIKAELLTAARSRDAVVTMTSILDKDGQEWQLGPSAARPPFLSGMGDVYALAPGKQYLVMEAQAQGNNPAITAGLKIELSDGQSMDVMADDSWKSMVGKFRGAASAARLSPVVVHGTYGDNPGEMKKYYRPEPMPSPLLRKDFTLGREIKRARAYVAALGFAELYLNGVRVGDAVLDPAQTNFEHYSFYVAHDVTDLVKTGQNAMGIILGDGWYGQNQWLWNFGLGNMHYGKPSVRVKLVVDFTDGSRYEVVSDPTWKTADGPVLANNLWAGERFDARRILPAWSEPGFDDGTWQPVLVETPDIPALLPSPLPPIRRHDTLDIKEVYEPAPGVYVIDFGQNIAGWARIKISEEQGTRVRLRFAEEVNADKTLHFRSLGPNMHGLVPADEYTASGAAVEIWEPRFTYHSFRYAEVHGLSARPQKGDIVAVPVHTALESLGDFQCSDLLINRIHSMSRWTLLNNVHGKQTDCPGRERDEWNADAQVSAEFAIYNFDMLPMYNNLVDNIVTSRGMANQGIPGEVAVGKRCQQLTDVGWGTALIAIPWYLHVYYGDSSAAERHWEKMVAFLDWMGSVAPNYIVGYMKWGDHASIRKNLDGSDIPKCDNDALGTIHYAYSARMMADLAETLGKPGEAKKYRALATAVTQAFTARFLDTTTMSHGHQTIDAMALKYDMVPAQHREAVAASLARDVQSRDYGVVGGIFGHQPIFEELIKAGYTEIAWRAMRSTSLPGVSYSIEKGDATTIWEAFWPEDHRAFNYVSKNHPMFGSIDAVYYAYIAGIRPDPQHPGFRRFILKPDFTAYLSSARATHESPFGQIVSDWKRPEGLFTWNITVPPGTTAEAYVPAGDPDKVEWSMPCGADPKKYAVYQGGDSNFSVYLLDPGIYCVQVPYDEAGYAGIVIQDDFAGIGPAGTSVSNSVLEAGSGIWWGSLQSNGGNLLRAPAGATGVNQGISIALPAFNPGDIITIKANAARTDTTTAWFGIGFSNSSDVLANLSNNTPWANFNAINGAVTVYGGPRTANSVGAVTRASGSPGAAVTEMQFIYDTGAGTVTAIYGGETTHQNVTITPTGTPTLDHAFFVMRTPTGSTGSYLVDYEVSVSHSSGDTGRDSR